MMLAPEKRIPSPSTGELSFKLPDVPQGQQVRLALNARVDWPSLDGFNPWMSVSVNGHLLGGPNLLNKPVDFTTRNGVDFVWNKGGLWTILYSPDFSDEIRTRPMPWGFADTDPYRFVWDITRHVKAGENKVAFTHPQLLAQGTTLVLSRVQVEIGEPIKSMGGGGVTPAPEGPLPTYMARNPQRVAMKVSLNQSGGIRLKVGRRAFDIRSRTSEPDGKWVETGADAWRSIPQGKSADAHWKGSGYSVSRKVSVLEDHIHVADTLANTSDQLVGVMHEIRLALSQTEKPRILLAGRPPIGETYAAEDPGHPSAIAEWKDMALGLFAEDDIFRIHVSAFAELTAAEPRPNLGAEASRLRIGSETLPFPGNISAPREKIAPLDSRVIGLADPRLGIPPGKSHTLEWSIYPAPKGDYWDVINAVRRNWGCNFTIPGPTLFDHPTDGSKSQEHYNDMVRSRQVKLVFSGQTAFQGDEIKDGIDLAEGTAIPMAKKWCSSAAEWVRKLHTADPSVKAMVYLHPSICTEPKASQLYADSLLLDSNGVHVTSPYRYPVYEYVSSLDNSYGKALFETLKQIFLEINPDGIFMDEISHGSVPQYAFRTAWDGCTVRMDPATHAVTGQCSSVVLLEQSWKTAMVAYLRERGKLLVGNGPAYTRTMLGWKPLLLTELGSYSFLINMHLSSPIALGNHDNDNDDPTRARMIRRALDHAGVIYVYSWGDRPQGLHPMHFMFPITPVELRPGMILGEERILTNRSGCYGWPDGGAASVYVFDGKGKLAEKPWVKEKRKRGHVLTEIRMPSDHFAVLVRKSRETADRGK